MSDIIPGLKLISHTGVHRGYDEEDPVLPFRLTVNLSPPEGGGVGWVLVYGGSEVVVVRGATRAAIDAFLTRNEFRTHPRFRWFTIEERGKLIAEQRR